MLRDYRINEYEDDDDEGGGEGLRGYKLEKANGDGPRFRRGKPLVIWIMGKSLIRTCN